MGRRTTKERVLSVVLMFAMVFSLITGISVTEVRAEGEVIISSGGSIAYSNTSRNVAVGQDGTIYVCWHSGSGVFVAKSTDNGKSFSEGVQVADADYECEVTVSSIGRVYVAYRKDSEVHVAYSDDKGATFTDVTAVSDFSGGWTVHIATDGSHVYVVGNLGTTLVKSDDGGVTYKTVTISLVEMAFSDIFVDTQTHMITVVEDDPSVMYYTSTDYGETFSEAYIPMVDEMPAMVYYSVGTGGKTNGTTYAYMAGGYFSGENQFLYRFNPLTNETIKVDVEDCSTNMGRSITADNKGNVAVGFTSSDGAVSFQVSHDGGETFGDSVAVAYSESSNACINPVTGELMFLYVNQSGEISLKTYAGKLTGYGITTDPASLSFYKEEGAVGKKVSILCNGEDTAITGITATGDFTVSYEGELPTLKNGESFPITVQYKNTADAALTGSVEITYGTGSKVTLPVTVYENVGGVEYKYGINIDSANGDVAIYADDEPLEEPQSYKNKTIKLVATPNTGYNFTGWTVVSGGITLSSASEATTTFTMPQGAVSIKADYELAGTAGAEDKKKVEDAQKEAEEVLAALTPDNNETENDIIEAVKNALKDAGLEDVGVAIENFNKTEATTENPGSVTGTLKLTSGGESKEIPFEKEIAKLTPPEQPNKDAEKVAAAKEAVEKALGEQKVTNDTTKEELLKAAQDAAGEGVEVTIENFNKTEATTQKAGSVSGTVKITSGKESAEVPFEKVIDKLTTPEEKPGETPEEKPGETPEEKPDESLNGWVEDSSENYWFEDGVKQGTEGRGKEIYDPSTDAWYFLDAVDGGKMATNKDVAQPIDWTAYNADPEGYGLDNSKWKWVRYDEDGRMVKGWDTKEVGVYYFDLITGQMTKGDAEIDDKKCYFDEVTGIGANNYWVTIDGVDYWYENAIRQGYEKNNISYRGKEIYDPASDAWYWLDNIDEGKKAVSKDVYQESLAGEWGDMTNEAGEKIGKWVRYDENGHMVKGWSADHKYYFDPIYGTMAKGTAVIDGKTYTFDKITGELIR